MARIIKIGKPFSYESSSLKTPNFKEITPAPCSYDSTNKDDTPQPIILMDEFGQTPDHYYLARKPPPSYIQVKRKLDLQAVGSPKSESTRPTRTRQKKKIVTPEKPKGLSYPDGFLRGVHTECHQRKVNCSLTSGSTCTKETLESPPPIATIGNAIISESSDEDSESPPESSDEDSESPPAEAEPVPLSDFIPISPVILEI